MFIVKAPFQMDLLKDLNLLDYLSIYHIHHRTDRGIFEMVYNKKRNRLFMITETDLFEYSFNTNSWIKYSVIPSIASVIPMRRFYPSGFDPIAIDCDQQIIYVHYTKKSIATFTISDNNEAKLKIIHDLEEMKYVYGGRAIMINNDLHVMVVIAVNTLNMIQIQTQLSFCMFWMTLCR